jgi:hypothetical protein
MTASFAGICFRRRMWSRFVTQISNAITIAGVVKVPAECRDSNAEQPCSHRTRLNQVLFTLEERAYICAVRSKIKLEARVERPFAR